MDDILTTLKNMSFPQMVLAWAFVSCYALALGGMLGPVGSLRAGGVALLAGGLFAAFSDNWVHGALLVLFAVAGMGLFVTASWALAFTTAWLIRRRDAAAPAPEAPATPVARREPVGMLRAIWRSFVAS